MSRKTCKLSTPEKNKGKADHNTFARRNCSLGERMVKGMNDLNLFSFGGLGSEGGCDSHGHRLVLGRLLSLELNQRISVVVVQSETQTQTAMPHSNSKTKRNYKTNCSGFSVSTKKGMAGAFFMLSMFLREMWTESSFRLSNSTSSRTSDLRNFRAKSRSLKLLFLPYIWKCSKYHYQAYDSYVLKTIEHVM